MLLNLFFVIPWVVCLCIFIGMAILLVIICVLDQALARLSQLPAPVPVPPTPTPIPEPTPIPPPPTPVPPPVPPPKPVPEPPKPIVVGPFATAPDWFRWAFMEIGFHEIGNNQGLERYIRLGHSGNEGDPWCAIFVNAALEDPTFQDDAKKLSVPGTRDARSRSFSTNPNFVKLAGPCLGAIVVFWRGSQDSGLGHVGFYRGENTTHIWVLGGNENDMVQIEALPKSSASFGLLGYWWPKSVALPTIGPIIMPVGTSTSMRTRETAGGVDKPLPTSGVHTNIVASFFGGQKSAYGGAINDEQMGVALPFRFTGTRPRVRVTGKKNGVTVDCDIVDVGPWNINDPYWQNGTRPQAETGYDLGQVSHGVPRKTNSAGIDLTLAAAKATGIDGKGLVDWSFIGDDTSSNPKVT
jgi:uncharacterized protein (TIGR02594 family)